MPPRETLAEMIARHADAAHATAALSRDAMLSRVTFQQEQEDAINARVNAAQWPTLHEIAASMARDEERGGLDYGRNSVTTVVTERGQGYVHTFGVDATYPKLRGAK